MYRHIRFVHSLADSKGSQPRDRHAHCQRARSAPRIVPRLVSPFGLLKDRRHPPNRINGWRPPLPPSCSGDLSLDKRIFLRETIRRRLSRRYGFTVGRENPTARVRSIRQSDQPPSPTLGHAARCGAECLIVALTRRDVATRKPHRSRRIRKLYEKRKMGQS